MQKHDETDARNRELNNIGACAPDEDTAVAAPVAKSDGEIGTAVGVDLEAEDAANKSERAETEVSAERDNLPVSGERLNSNVVAKEE